MYVESFNCHISYSDGLPLYIRQYSLFEILSISADMYSFSFFRIECRLIMIDPDDHDDPDDPDEHDDEFPKCSQEKYDVL